MPHHRANADQSPICLARSSNGAIITDLAAAENTWRACAGGENQVGPSHPCAKKTHLAWLED